MSGLCKTWQQDWITIAFTCSTFRESTQVYLPIYLNLLINKEKPEIASNAHFYYFSVADVVNVHYITYGSVSDFLYWYVKGMKPQKLVWPNGHFIFFIKVFLRKFNVAFPSISGWRLKFDKLSIDKALRWVSGRRDCLVGGLYFLGSPRALLELTLYQTC